MVGTIFVSITFALVVLVILGVFVFSLTKF